MKQHSTEQTRATARAYFDAWTNRRSEATAHLLSEDFVFEGAGMQIEGRDAFLAADAFPRTATVALVADAYDGDTAFQMYDATNAAATVRIVERLHVAGGQIEKASFVADLAAFQAFMAGDRG